MTIKEIIDGLKFTVDMFLFDPTTGETYKEPRNDMDKTTIDACNGAIELLEQTRWIPVSERLPEKEMNCLVTDSLGKVHKATFYHALDGRESYFSGLYCVRAWMPLPEPYKAEREVLNADNS